VSLTPGSRLGPYEINAQIGAGGMGEVYRARDTKLGRDVALKVLPQAFAADPERLARMRREAHVLAALNHPNIAAIHGFEDTGDTHALVLEFVDGETLAHRIAQGPIPLDEALPIARQIAEALEAAHEQGIIHRDLKPANIKVRPDGMVKVLDFGLAKLNEPALATRDAGLDGAKGPLSLSPTITSPALMTRVGVLLGTAAYMSPEQTKGRAADKRSDIWAFGCVLYEMLTGRRAFDGEDMTDVLGAVARLDPNWEAVPPGVPDPIRTLMHRCLVKDPRARIGDIAAVRFVLDHQADPMTTAPVHQGSPPARSFVRRLQIPAAILITGATTAAAMVFLLPRPTPQPVTRLMVEASGDARVAIDPNDRAIAISPDGSKVAYTGARATVYGAGVQSSLFVRALDQLQPTLLAGPGNVREPFFSPDGAWVGFFDPVIPLKKVSASGGPPIQLATLDSPSRGATWGPDDAIIYATVNPETGLLRISSNGGEPIVLTRPNQEKGERDHVWPHVLPGGRAVLFTIVPNGPIEDAQIAVLDLRNSSYKVVLRGASDARYVEGGYLVYGLAGTLRAVAFDVDRLEVRGTPVPVLQQVVTTPTGGAANFAVAANGTLAYVSGSGLGETRTVVWVDRDGHEEPLKVPPRAYASVRLSPDGTRIALDVRDEQNDIWIWDLQRQTMTRLTFDPSTDNSPTWTPDGRRIAFMSSREGVPRLHWQAADGTGAAELLGDVLGGQPFSFSPDGTRLLFGAEDLAVLTIDGRRRMEPLLKDAWNAEMSPDGRWLAYQSSESGRDEIYVRPFPNVNGGKWQVSAEGGTRPVWARDGRELFYYTASRGMIAVPIRAGTTFAAGTAAVVFGGPAFSVPADGRMYDMSADGRRFLMIKQAPATGERTAAPLQLVVVQHFDEELKRLVPPSR
jgi:Tol biopolymer transport system component